MNTNSSDTLSDKNSQNSKQHLKFDSRTLKEIDEIIMSDRQGHASAKPAGAGDSGNVEEEAVSVIKDNNNLTGPIGIDIGTTSIVAVRNNCRDIVKQRQLNCFYIMPYSKIVKESLIKDGANLFCKNNNIYVYGSKAEELAVLYGENIRKTVLEGILNNKEDDCLEVISSIINFLVGKPVKEGETICFNLPGESIDGSRSTVFHESVIAEQLRSAGYNPKKINEGLAVVYSELADNNFTGIGVSIDGGMTNVCLSYLAVPVITYSFKKGGDYIDKMVSDAVGNGIFNIRTFKENSLDLSQKPDTKTQTALHVFYDELFLELAKSLESVLSSSDRIPKITKGLPLVLSGGSVMPKGSKEKFKTALQEVKLPFVLSDIIVADDPISSTALGSLRMATEEIV